MLIQARSYPTNILYKKKYLLQHKDIYIDYEIIKHQMFILILDYQDKSILNKFYFIDIKNK